MEGEINEADEINEAEETLGQKRDDRNGAQKNQNKPPKPEKKTE